MAEIAPDEFARLLARAGLAPDADRAAELRQGYRYIERMQRNVRQQPRDRAVEPAHIFIHPKD
jgi:hypothetical protein